MNGKQISILGIVALSALVFSIERTKFHSVNSVATVPVAEQISSMTAPAAHVQESAPKRITTARRTGSAPPVRETVSTTATSSTILPGNAAASTEIASTTQEFVTIQLIDPDGTSIFPVQLLPGADACSVLVEAKAEGKLSSLTLDDSYKDTFGSSYVREMNGFSNDWTFAVGGVEPNGCSLYLPKPGETIVWRFGAGK